MDIFTYRRSSNLVFLVILVSNFSACYSIFPLGEDKGSVIGVDDEGVVNGNDKGIAIV